MRIGRGLDCASNEPRSRIDHATIARQSWFVIFLYKLSDEDRAEVSPRGAHRLPNPAI